MRGLARDRLVCVLAVVVAAAFAYLVLLSVLTPPSERDVTTYHLTRALLWIQDESVGPVADASDPRINEFPVNAELLQGATMLLAESSRWVGLVQLSALLAAVLAVYGIAGRLGIDRPQAAFGALLFATLPVVALQAPTALNDLVVAALAAITAFFVLGRTRGDGVLACLALALLVGTKGTALLALPVLFVVAILVHRGRRLAFLLAGGVLGTVVGASWYAVNVADGKGLLGSVGDDAGGVGDGAVVIASRATRYLVESFELPGATGRDRFVYVIAAAAVLVAGLAARRPRTAVLAAGMTLATLLVLPAERVMHSIYWNGWELVGYDAAVELGTIRDSTVASNVQSWYGPVGLVAVVLATVLVARGAARGVLPWVAVALAAAPVAFLLATAVAVTYFDFNGRFVMGGVALSAGTWGVVRRLPAVPVALVAVAGTGMVLGLVNYAERPAGIDLLEGTDRPSTWTLPREWAQSIQPELAVLIGYADDRIPTGQPIGLHRTTYYPFAYVGYPGLEHRLVYADSLAEARRRGVAWAVLPLRTPCRPGWRLAFGSTPWGIYRRLDSATCPPGAGR